MKTAIYIEDGTVQLVITPETEFEKSALTTFRDRPLDAKLFTGSFYDCRGGWIRQSAYYESAYTRYGSQSEDSSLILRVGKPLAPDIRMAPDIRNESASEAAAA